MRNVSLYLGLGLLAFAFGCNDGSGPPIHFIAPNGFRGNIDIIHDAKNGTNLVNREGTLLCVIPATGQLRVKSLKPFQSWHSETASYADGTPLRSANGISSISFFALGAYASGSTQGVTYFIGTKAEADLLKY